MTHTEASAPVTALQPRIAWPGQPGYEQAQPWNRAIVSEPRAVVHAQSTNDIVEAVRFAHEQGLHVAVLRTGHGAVAIDDDTLVIYTGALNECTVHPEGRWARVGAGALWQEVITAAAPHGLAPVCGSAPGVGVAGFLTGGGVGPLARTYGFGSDHVRAIEVVTGTGQWVRATPNDHEDLFYGLRGGKATLGIVAAVEIDLVALPEFYGGCLWFERADTAKVLRGWLRMCEQLPEQGTSSAAIVQLPPLPDLQPQIAGRQTLAVRFAWTGDAEAGAQQLAGLRELATPLLDDVHLRPSAEIGQVHSDPVEPMPVHDHFALLHSLDDVALERLVGAVERDRNVQVIVELRQLGGALARPPRHRSAVCHRDAAYALFMSGVPGTATPAIEEQAQRILAALSEWTADGLWPNFRASADPAVIARYYDGDTRHWLSALGEQYDPEQILNVGQVVRS